jgi:hypothetical protein
MRKRFFRCGERLLNQRANAGSARVQLALTRFGKLEQVRKKLVNIRLQFSGVLRYAGENLPLARLIKQRQRVFALVRGDLFAQSHALQKQREHALVYGVNFFAECVQFH